MDEEYDEDEESDDDDEGVGSKIRRRWTTDTVKNPPAPNTFEDDLGIYGDATIRERRRFKRESGNRR